MVDKLRGLRLQQFSNKMKSKRFRKLRFNCGICEKQCSDNNEYKSHCMSESHLNQLQTSDEMNWKEHVEKSSQEFEDGFLELMRRNHGDNRVAARVVYNEYLSDEKHVNQFATKWSRLKDFVVDLGVSGKCKMEFSENEWFITYIVRDSKAKGMNEIAPVDVSNAE
ncbi:KIN17-like protein [Spinacia oleracea]|uniref:KIN17-like protein n=1 Tax=Spinacia oleracea TaxID=3562 RepID=A0A9R0IG20_SPIOL|nr:KIN17-like protein [Spinacia oleracea]